MVLRFRDLIDETIPEHRKYINTFGYVWWGWWNKPQEKVPYKELLHFREIIKDKGYMWIFLADSGTFRLYKAKLLEIDYNDNLERRECREIEKVPEYYFMAKYKVWFKFVNIEDAIPDEIREWSYDNPNDFLYGADQVIFQNKRILSIQEMLSQHHRTIYFIQPYDQKKHKDFSDESIKADNTNKEPFLSKIESNVDEILELIEEINKICDYAPRRVSPPIEIPQYPKQMEGSLKNPACDEIAFRDFSSNIYMLIVEGHRQVMKEDRAVISKRDLLTFADSLIHSIRLFRCDLHHSRFKPADKKRLGQLYQEVCGKSLLNDSNSRQKFQLKLLERTVGVLKKEHQLVIEKINQIQKIHAVG